MRTGEELLADFSVFLDDYWESVTDEDGSSDKSTLVDSAIANYGADTLVGGFTRILQGGSQYDVKRVLSFDPDAASVQAEGIYTTTIPANTRYQFHKHDPRTKLSVLNKARLLAFPEVSVVVFDETRTGDGQNRKIVLPPLMRTGPVQVYGEIPLGIDQAWNFLPQTGWTAGAGSTVTEYALNTADLVLPRRQNSCRLWAVTGASATTLSLTANQLLHSVTVGTLSGRRVTVGVWTYCRVANRVNLQVIDSSGTQFSNAHQGYGWEFLTVSFDVTPGTSIFTVQLAASAAANDVLVGVEEVYGMLGDYIPLCYDEAMTTKGTWRDPINGQVLLDGVPDRGQQLQLIGRRLLTDMGRTATEQAEAAVEIDETTQELLFAKAARLLYVGEGLKAGQIEAQFPKITEVEGRFKEQAMNFAVRPPNVDTVKVWGS